jgi:hypothetical protein
MKVSVVMNAMPRYTTDHWLLDMQSLVERNCQSQSLPYTGNLPLPSNIDIVRNVPGGSINAQKLELKAAALGVDRLTWLFSADAEFLGLELRDSDGDPSSETTTPSPYYDPDPVILLARIRGRETSLIDAQCAYFIDQFTEASLNRCYSYANHAYIGNQEAGGDEPIQKRRCLIAGNILFALQNYDTGISDKPMQKSIRKAISRNSKIGSPEFIKAKTAYEMYTRNYGGHEKLIFNSVRTYAAAQAAAYPVMGNNFSARTEQVNRASRTLLGNIRSFVKVNFDSHVFISQLASSQFDMNPSPKIEGQPVKQQGNRS